MFVCFSPTSILQVRTSHRQVREEGGTLTKERSREFKQLEAEKIMNECNWNLSFSIKINKQYNFYKSVLQFIYLNVVLLFYICKKREEREEIENGLPIHEIKRSIFYLFQLKLCFNEQKKINSTFF